MVVAFGLGSGSCLVHFLSSNAFIPGIDYYMHRKVVESLRVYIIRGLCIGSILFLGFGDNAQAAFVQLPVCKEPPSDRVEAQ